MVVTVQNSYLHDGKYGVFASTSSSKYPDTEITITNNTIVDNGTGIHLTAPSGDTIWEYFNNIIVGSTSVGAYVSSGRSTSLDYGSNAWYDNAARFDGEAKLASDSITSDPDLDWTVAPPVPASTSGLSGAGTSLSGVSDDYWGVTRPSPPCIGAVEP